MCESLFIFFNQTLKTLISLSINLSYWHLLCRRTKPWRPPHLLRQSKPVAPTFRQLSPVIELSRAACVNQVSSAVRISNGVNHLHIARLSRPSRRAIHQPSLELHPSHVGDRRAPERCELFFSVERRWLLQVVSIRDVLRQPRQAERRWLPPWAAPPVAWSASHACAYPRRSPWANPNRAMTASTRAAFFLSRAANQFLLSNWAVWAVKLLFNPIWPIFW